MMGIISFSTNCRAVCRTSFSSSFSCESKSMKSTPPYPAILLSSSKAVPAQPGPMRAGKDGAQSFRPLVKSSSGNDLLLAPFPDCVAFGHGSSSPSIASPRKHQQQTAPRELVDALEGTGRFPQTDDLSSNEDFTRPADAFAVRTPALR